MFFSYTYPHIAGDTKSGDGSVIDDFQNQKPPLILSFKTAKSLDIQGIYDSITEPSPDWLKLSRAGHRTVPYLATILLIHKG